MHRHFFSRIFLWLLILNYFQNLALKFHVEEPKGNGYEKSIAHVIRTEVKETGNKFVLLFHALQENDEGLNALVKELNENCIPLFTFSQRRSDQR